MISVGNRIRNDFNALSMRVMDTQPDLRADAFGTAFVIFGINLAHKAPKSIAGLRTQRVVGAPNKNQLVSRPPAAGVGLPLCCPIITRCVRTSLMRVFYSSPSNLFSAPFCHGLVPHLKGQLSSTPVCSYTLRKLDNPGRRSSWLATQKH